MNINELISIIKKKLIDEIKIEDILIEDKSFLHKNHASNQKDKFHIKISIQSDELKKMSKIDSNKKIYKVLDKEMKLYIHSLQILIS
tara:strand:+ start:16423 stop:16683 length:261 start_codon:yes stop_codon:yes gene_type:complete